MLVLTLVGITVVTLFTIIIVEAIPFKRVLLRYPLTSLALNFGVSWLVAFFAGQGMNAGLWNLSASVLAFAYFSVKYGKRGAVNKNGTSAGRSS